jgi:type I restriction enzyme S subunit
MKSDWPLVALVDVAEECRYGYTASAVDDPVGPQFLRITDFASSALDWAGVPYCQIDQNQVSKYELRDGDVVIARTGPVGAAWFVRNPPPSVFASYLVRFRFRRAICDPRFMGFLLRSPQWQRYVNGARTGSVQPQLNATLMKRFEFALPPLEEQRRVSWVLGSLEDKIENNRQLAQTLERIAATLFKARFVDFVGHDDLVDTELGRIPRGWHVRPIGDVLRVVGGSTPSTKHPAYWEGGVHCWATPKDLSGLGSPILSDTSRRITDAGVSRISSGLLPQRTVLLSSRAPVGYTVISAVPIAVNQGFIAVPPDNAVPSEFVLFWLRARLDEIKAHAGGTTFAEISKRAFRPLRILVPPLNVLKAFENVARPLLDSIAALDRESRTLSRIRDRLLPRLVSGRAQVSELAQPDRAAEAA